jgi:hypothetical protein
MHVLRSTSNIELSIVGFECIHSVMFQHTIGRDRRVGLLCVLLYKNKESHYLVCMMIV